MLFENWGFRLQKKKSVLFAALTGAWARALRLSTSQWQLIQLLSTR
jgi:hypothetical protein